MANRAVESDGLATHVHCQRVDADHPGLRSSRIMLMMMPIALLFILTPINLRVASFALGLFVFVALWGVIDAGIYQLTLGRAMDVLAELRANATSRPNSLDPGAIGSAMKALAIFGSFRTAGRGPGRRVRVHRVPLLGQCVHGLHQSAYAPGIQSQGTMAAATVEHQRGLCLRARSAGFGAAGTLARRSTASSLRRFRRAVSQLWSRTAAFGVCRMASWAEHGGGATWNERRSGLAGLDAARDLGGLSPALARTGSQRSGNGAAPIRANAATSAIHNFARRRTRCVQARHELLRPG
jgi:conjugal transfer mating pair stabilization protein TraG